MTRTVNSCSRRNPSGSACYGRPGRRYGSCRLPPKATIPIRRFQTPQTTHLGHLIEHIVALPEDKQTEALTMIAYGMIMEHLRLATRRHAPRRETDRRRAARPSAGDRPPFARDPATRRLHRVARSRHARCGAPSRPC